MSAGESRIYLKVSGNSSRRFRGLLAVAEVVRLQIMQGSRNSHEFRYDGFPDTRI